MPSSSPGRLEALQPAAKCSVRLGRSRRLGWLPSSRDGRTPGQRAEIVHAAKVAFVSGFNEILLIGAVVAFVGATLGFALVRVSDFVQPTEAPESAAA